MFRIKSITLKTEKGLVCKINPKTKRFSSLEYLIINLEQIEKMSKKVEGEWLKKTS